MPLNVHTLKTPISSGDIRLDSIITDSPNETSLPGWNLNYIGLFRPFVTYTFSSAPSLFDVNEDVWGVPWALERSQAHWVKHALDYVSYMTGISFQEVKAGDADWYFFNGDLKSNAAAQSHSAIKYNYDRSNGALTYLEYDGAIIFDASQKWTDTYDLHPGNFGYEALLHEIGHLLGLGHPHSGPVILPAALDTSANTIMSYNSTRPYKYEFSPYDLDALLYLYGNDGIVGEYGYDKGSTASDTVYVFKSSKIGEGVNPTSQGYFYTSSPDEAEFLRTHETWPWVEQAPTFEAAHSNPSEGVPLYVFWSDKHQSHYYTVSEAEKDQIIEWSKTGKNGYDWQYSGTAFNVYADGTPTDGGGNPAIPVYMLWMDDKDFDPSNGVSGGHYFTADYDDYFSQLTLVGVRGHGVAFYGEPLG